MMTQQHLEDVTEASRWAADKGKVASYIPKLAEADPHQLGVYLMDLQGRGVGAGDWHKRVTIQSIVKVAIFLQALADCPLDKLNQKISLNATAGGFNSIVEREERNHHKPLNPFINSGAIASLFLVNGEPGERFDRVMELVKSMTAEQRLEVDEDVYLSEKEQGSRNRAIAYFMQSTGIIEGDVEQLLDEYFRLCSLQVDCRDLACVGATLANGGVNPVTRRACALRQHCRTALAVMVSCGMYEQSGEFLVQTGVPAKSGVGGGIMASIPGRMGLGLIGPALNEAGNSSGGIELLTRLADELDLSIL